jgi:tRNA A-37 threonylcarbamoyl transferase component Bud32
MSEPDGPRGPPAGSGDAPTTEAAAPPTDSAATLVRVLDQYLADLQAGRAPDRAALLAAHPHLAAQLESCLAALDFIHKAERPAGAPTQLGDFRIVREVGRGGMGVVYEAEQVSLKRRVALKVLRFGATSDPEAMARFQREAETVAGLHHTNIVPIFAVGCAQGVHYFAMQFIDGTSLDALLKSTTTKGQGLDPKDVARWGLQAAEALAHAHQRGVIHRDVKPSNLLLDREGIVWLTDFGLARRSEEVTLTVAGVLLGTPRYMSPEQAATLQQAVDHRTDVYSLGATLYELATGRPVFEADTPQAVLAQIQSAEPVPPRRVRKAVPRDLETIILKCLAKEPPRRYATAQELADDLRRFLNGEPIRAKRPGLVQRALRWANQQRKSGALMPVATAVLLLLAVAGWVGWGFYRQAQQGTLELQAVAGGEQVRIEVLDGDERILGPTPLPLEKPLSLQPGWDDVRVSAPARLSETYQVLVEPGVERRYPLGLSEPPLGPPLDVSHGFEVVESGPSGAQLIVLTEKSLQRVDPSTGKVAWQQAGTLSGPGRDRPGHSDRDMLGFLLGKLSWDFRIRHGLQRPDTGLLRPPPDLDGDRYRDLVWALPGQPWLLAISGRDGRILWAFHTHFPGLRFRDDPGEAVGVVAAAPAGPLQVLPYLYGGLAELPPPQLIGPPLVEDVDGDGKPDLLAVFASEEPLNETPRAGGSGTGRYLDIHQGDGPHDHRVSRVWVEAISGRTGQRLWRHDLAPHYVSSFLSDRRVPLQTASLLALGPQPLHLVSFQAVAEKWRHFFNVHPRNPFWRYHAAVTHHDGRRLLVVRADGRAALLDVRTGQRHADIPPLDGALLHALRDGTGILLGGSTEQSWKRERRPTHVWARSLLTGAYLWESINRHGARPYADREVRNPQFLGDSIISALPEDGKVGLQVLDAATGKVRWQRTFCRCLPPETPGDGLLIRFAFRVEPRLGGGGEGVVLAAALIRGDTFGYPEEQVQLLTAACSLADGRLLGQRLQVLAGTIPRLPPGRALEWSLRWLPMGERGWPLLGVTYRPAVLIPSEADTPPQTFLYSAGGKLMHTWPDVFDLHSDNAGTLYAAQRAADRRGQERMLLHVARVGSPELWRRPGKWWPGGAVAFPSGPPPPDPGQVAPPLPHGDLDGDGVADVLLCRTGSTDEHNAPVLQAYSGKDGSRIWQLRPSQLLANRTERYKRVTAYWLLHCCDLEGDGRPEVLLGYWYEGGDGNKSIERQCWLAVLDGRTGKLCWEEKLAERHERQKWGHVHPYVAGLTDVNGDGVRDLVVFTDRVDDPHPTFRALDGRTGERLWARPVEGSANEDPRNLQAKVLKDLAFVERWPFFSRNGGHWTGSGRKIAILPPVTPDGPPSVVCHLDRPPATVCRQIEIVDGRRLAPLPDFGPQSADGRLIIPLPWAPLGHQRLTQAAGLALAALGLVMVFALAKRRRTAGWLLVLLVGVPLLVGIILLFQQRALAEERYDWGGWYWLWPYALSGLRGWELLRNPLVWMLAWTVLLVLRRLWAKGTHPGAGRVPSGTASG